MMYREVREYRDKYPNVALLPMENGVGPVPILMAGAASQSSLRGGLSWHRVCLPIPLASRALCHAISRPGHHQEKGEARSRTQSWTSSSRSIWPLT